MTKLIIKVVRIKGTCSVYEVGERIVIDEGYKLNLKETDRVCMHSLASIMPYYVAVSAGVDPSYDIKGCSESDGVCCFRMRILRKRE